MRSRSNRPGWSPRADGTSMTPLVGLAAIRPRRVRRKLRWLLFSPTEAYELRSSAAAISSESLAYGPASRGAVLAGRECVQLVRLRADPSVRDHLPAPVPRLLDSDRRLCARRDPGSWHPRYTSLGSPARPLRAKPILIAANLASALGYAGFAFVDRPWQAFACAVVGGAGVGAASTANQTLLITLVAPEQRAASFALGRVAQNVGLGIGATAAGFIVSWAQHLGSFQALYLFDALTFAALALVVLAKVPHQRAAAAPAGAVGRGFRAVVRDR